MFTLVPRDPSFIPSTNHYLLSITACPCLSLGLSVSLFVLDFYLQTGCGPLNHRLALLLFFFLTVKKNFFFIYLAAPGLSCSMWDLIP